MGCWQQLCCARVLRVKAKVLRRPWRDRALPEKRNRFLPVDEVKEEGAISRVYDTEMTVLVTDLKGFTSTTKKHGIIHFASIIIRKRQLCLPILHRYKAAHITTEADNLIVAFPSACDAAHAALELRAAIQKTNATLEEAKAHFAIQLNGVGIHCGVGLMQSAEGELLGEVARGAYVLGEDLCKGSEILVSEAVRLKLQEDPFFASASFNSREDQETGAIDFSYFELGGDWKDLQVDLASTEDQSFLHPSLLPLAQRHGKSGVELMMLDEAIHKHLRPQTVLMFSIDSQNGSQDEAAIMQMNKSRAALRPILEQHGGRALEAELFVFDQASQAVSAALAARAFG
ncbi:unnamed protein product [Effrenium voratum]|uniref:Guanylate cyclase domain-containing protein n=1 Tax=Effrenium voratum TaxID=2562239 RepID=A0AA36IBP0_9DINO|nr:unnamed protein product [Effrenium voratum]